MTHKQFLKKARRYARKNRVDFILDTGSEKGSHVKLTVSNRFTYVMYGEITPPALAAMFRQLGIARKEFFL